MMVKEYYSKIIFRTKQNMTYTPPPKKIWYDYFFFHDYDTQLIFPVSF